VRFAQYLLKHPGVDEHLRESGWVELITGTKFKIFKWLKHEQSPNWSVLEESLRKDKPLD
jgi:hypothetical protein